MNHRSRGLRIAVLVLLSIAALAATATAKESKGTAPAGYAWATSDLPTTLVNGRTYNLTITLGGTSSATSGVPRTSPPRADQQAMTFTITLMVSNWNGPTKQFSRTVTLTRNQKEVTQTFSYTPRISAFSAGKGSIWWAIKVATPLAPNAAFATAKVGCTLKTR